MLYYHKILFSNGTHLSTPWREAPVERTAAPTSMRLAPLGLTDLAQAHLLSVQLSITPREAEIGVLLLQGFTAKEIAVRLGRSCSTVRGHLEVMAMRLGTRNGPQLAALLVATLWYWSQSVPEQVRVTGL